MHSFQLHATNTFLNFSKYSGWLHFTGEVDKLIIFRCKISQDSIYQDWNY